MEAILREITALPKVIGCFLYSGSKGVTCSSMPPIFTEETIKEIGTILARAKQMSQEAELDLKAIHLRYNETILLARPLENNATLITLYEPGVNEQLLEMSISIAIDDLSNALKSDAKPPVSLPKEAPKPQTDPGLRPILLQIKEALAEEIGPIAEPILDECLEKWSTQGSQSIKRLPDLAWLICREIDDEKLEKRFMEKVKRFF